MKRLLLLTCHFWKKPTQAYFSRCQYMAKKLFSAALPLSKLHHSIQPLAAAKESRFNYFVAIPRGVLSGVEQGATAIYFLHRLQNPMRLQG